MRRLKRGWIKARFKEKGNVGSRLTLALCAVVLLQACTVSGASFLLNNAGNSKVTPLSQPLHQRDAYTIRVTKGDTLYSIARTNQIDLRALIDENDLVPPYAIMPGDRLRIPAPRVHTVARGDTVYSIAREYDINRMTLASLNGIHAPYQISVGQKLQLPGGASGATAKKSGWLPGSKKQVKKKKTSVGKSTEAVARSTPRGGGKFRWPVHGTILSTYGSKGGGKQNDGVNIAVPAGTHVVAANDGTVTYAGNELRGYGNLILIRHHGGWVSAYAHTKNMWVKKGQAVARGQHIANVGQTGSATRPQLHFELRRGSKTVDPEKYLNVD